MLHSEQKINQDRQKTFAIDHWPIFAILAAVSILFAGLAIGIFKFGPNLVPGHFMAEAPSAETIELSFVRQQQTNSPEALQFKPDEEVSEQTSKKLAAARLAKVEHIQANVIAMQEAKSALASKLAHRQLTRMVLSAQTTSGLKLPRTDVAKFAVAEAVVDTGTSVPAGNETVPAPATEPEASAVVAELPHPIPRSKPQAPRVTVAASSVEKPGKPNTALGYAAAGNPEAEEGSVFSGIGKLFSGSKAGLPGRHRGIAVYDISAATVHMPDGTKLEAHSGIGHRKDNPKYAHVKNLGPTPPNIYDLRMRESLFHGVEAIRMTPRDIAAMKGRDGMLAHTPLLRRGNGSHGCVAFKDYKKFLKAFKAGKVKKMIVVPSMNELPTYMASL